MPKTVWNLRVDANELAKWKAKAADEGLLLAEWVRSLCNGECEDMTKATKTNWKAIADDMCERGEYAVCVCTHKKSKHGGFGGCCQEDNCLCVGFKGE